MPEKALEGVKVLDLTHHIAGPWCTKLMADFGADVLKVERPEGDPARRMAPFYHDEIDAGKSLLFFYLNTSKRGMTLNLKAKLGREALLKLAQGCDVLVENFSPRVMPSLGLDYQTLRELNPSLVMAMLLVALMVPRFVNAAAVRDVATLHFLEPPRPDEYRNQDIFDYYEDWQLAQYLTARTDPQDKIQIWGFESLVYHLADRSAASRFQATQPLIMRVLGRPLGPMQHRWRDEFVNAIRRENPVYVAVVRGDRWWWSPEGQTSEELLGDFPEWQEIIQSEYTLETEIGRFAVYRLTAQP